MKPRLVLALASALANFHRVTDLTFADVSPTSATQPGTYGADMELDWSVGTVFGHNMLFTSLAKLQELDPKYFRGRRTLVVMCCADSSCWQQLESLNEELYRSNVHWLIMFESSPTDLFTPDIPLRLDSNFLVTFLNDDSSATDVKVELTEWYRIKRGHMIKSPFGTFKRESGRNSSRWLLHVSQPVSHVRRANFHGSVLTNLMTDWLPLAGVVPLPGSDKFSPVGYIPNVARDLSLVLNFTLEYHKQKDGVYGTKQEDGNWSGIVGQLASSSFDLSSAGLTVTADRQDAVDFTLGIFVDKATIIERSTDGNKKAAMNAAGFFNVFPVTVWLLLLLSLFLTSSSYLILRASPDGLIRGAAIYFLALLQLGSNDNEGERSVSGRVLLLTVYLSCYLIFENYCADLTAVLATGPPSFSLNTFQDLVENDYSVISLAGHAENDFLTSSAGPHLKQVLLDADEWLGMREALHQHDGPAVIFDSFLGYSDDHSVVPRMDFDDAVSSHLAIGLGKDSEFKAMFSYHLLKARQSGLFQRLALDWLEQGRPPDASRRIFVEDPAALGVGNLLGPASVLALGVVLSVATVCVESMLERRVK